MRGLIGHSSRPFCCVAWDVCSISRTEPRQTQAHRSKLSSRRATLCQSCTPNSPCFGPRHNAPAWRTHRSTHIRLGKQASNRPDHKLRKLDAGLTPGAPWPYPSCTKTGFPCDTNPGLAALPRNQEMSRRICPCRQPYISVILSDLSATTAATLTIRSTWRHGCLRIAAIKPPVLLYPHTTYRITANFSNL